MHLIVALFFAAAATTPTATGRAAAAGSGHPFAWPELRHGVQAYTGDDGRGARVLTVCRTANLYKNGLRAPQPWYPNVRKSREVFQL